MEQNGMNLNEKEVKKIEMQWYGLTQNKIKWNVMK